MSRLFIIGTHVVTADLLAIRPDLVLVSRDKRLLNAPDMAPRVVSSNTFAATEWDIEQQGQAGIQGSVCHSARAG